jgi:chaperone BCS1
MNDSINFVLLQSTSKFIIIVEDLNRFLMEKLTAVSLFVDVRIYFPFCDFLAFKTLVNSYLRLKDHKLFSQVDDIFQSRESLNLAEISKLMITN